jgi:Tfp pilus assembly protein PilF
MASGSTQIEFWWQKANEVLLPFTAWFQDVQNAPVWIAGVAVVGVVGFIWKSFSDRAKAKRDAADKAAEKLELAEIKQMLANLQAQAAARGEAALSAESADAFVKAAVEIGAEGDAAEREALRLLAEGKTAEARARLEGDIQQAAGQAIEKLRRMGALLAPVDTKGAKDAYERLLTLAPGDLDARNELGTLLFRFGDLAGAEAAYRAVFEGAGSDQSWEAIALGNLGLIARTRGDLDAAVAHQQRALTLHEQLGRKEGMANNLVNLGVIAQTRGDLDAAEDYQKRALALNEQLGRKEGMADTNTNLGIIAGIRGDLDAAEDYLKRSLNLYEQFGNKRGMAITLGNLGNIAETRGDLDAAEDYQKRAQALHKLLGHKVGMASTLGNLGNIAKIRGDLDAAEDYLKRTLALFEQLGSKHGMAIALGNLGVIAARRGDRTGARAHLTAALSLYEGIGAGTSQDAQVARENLAKLGPG